MGSTTETMLGADLSQLHPVVIGAGPAGLTAAYTLVSHGVPCTVLEADSVVGGIARTVERDGWRFDIGGHRFFTKVKAVENLWFELLGEENLLLRPRMSRIYYRGEMFDYPLRTFNALRGLGVVEAVRCFLSYLWVKAHPPRDQEYIEGWTAARFGWRLYRIFFKTYTEKVWGMPATQIKADWAAQRIKDLSLMKAMLNAVLPKRKSTDVTSLIDEFRYPKYGPGMMWEFARAKVGDAGSEVIMRAPVTTLHRHGGRAVAVTAQVGGEPLRFPASHVVSSMPLSEMVQAIKPPAPDDVLEAAAGLRYRDFLTVALIVPLDYGFPDNWIYIHDPEVKVGRIQNFGSWSPFMVKDGKTCLGLEYFVTEGDPLWTMQDDELIDLATREITSLQLVDGGRVERGYVVRMPKAYPLYDDGYKERIAVIRRWLESQMPNVYPVGRNGMHRYNNQDHSMLTAILAVENIRGAHHDIWAVNVGETYLEEDRSSKGRDRKAAA